MAGPYHFLNNRMEDAVKAFILSGDDPSPAEVYTYGELVGYGEKVAEPYIGVRCVRGLPGFPELSMDSAMGNMSLTVQVAVRSHAEHETDATTQAVTKNGRDAHGQLVGRVMDLFHRSDIISALQTAANTVGNLGIDQVHQMEVATENTGRSYITLLEFMVDCHPVV